MKKLLLSLVALFSVMSFVSAEDKITVDDVQLRQGKTGELLIRLECEHSLRGTQFDLILPAGVSIIADDEGVLDVNIGSDQHRLYLKGVNVINKYTDVNRYRLVSYIQEETSEGIPPLANGVLFRIGIEATGSFSVGQTLSATITGSDEPASSPVINFSDANDAQVSYTQEDLTFSIEIVEDQLFFDEDDETLPVYVVGETSNVTVKRTIKPNTWNTIALPFAVKKDDVAGIFGSDASFAQFDSWEAEFDEDGVPTSLTIKFTERKKTLATVLAAGTPYLVKTSKEITEIANATATLAESKNLSKDYSEEEYYGETYSGTFVSTFVKSKIPNRGLFIRDNKFYYSNGETIIKGFRGFFNLGLIMDELPDSGVKMQILVDDEPTNVEGLEIRSSNGAVFSIDGKKMNNDVDHLRKGVYIIDGKKVVVK